jgi:hypothetical protein
MILHVGVEQIHCRFLVKPAGNAGLIGDDEDVVAGVIEQTHGHWRSGRPFEIIDPVNITAVDIENAVAIEKCCGTNLSGGKIKSRRIKILRDSDIDKITTGRNAMQRFRPRFLTADQDHSLVAAHEFCSRFLYIFPFIRLLPRLCHARLIAAGLLCRQSLQSANELIV